MQTSSHLQRWSAGGLFTPKDALWFGMYSRCPLGGICLVNPCCRAECLLKIWPDVDPLYFDFDAFTTHSAYFERSIMQQCPSHRYHPTPCCTLKWELAIERRALSSKNNSLISFSFRVSKNKSHIVFWSG